MVENVKVYSTQKNQMTQFYIGERETQRIKHKIESRGFLIEALTPVDCLNQRTF